MDLSIYLELEPLVSKGMSTFQMENFVINDNITPYRKLRQAIIEAKTRMETMAMNSFEIEELEVKIEKMKVELDTISNQFDRKLKEIAIRKTEYEHNRLTKQQGQLESEAVFYLDTVKTLVETDLGGLDQIKNKLDDKDYHYQEESKFWTQRMVRHVYSDFVNYGTVSKGVLESIVCLPADQQRAIIEEATNYQLDFKRLLDRTRDTILVEND